MKVKKSKGAKAAIKGTASTPKKRGRKPVKKKQGQRGPDKLETGNRLGIVNRKPGPFNLKKRTYTLPAELLNDLEAAGIPNISHYIRDLLTADLKSRGLLNCVPIWDENKPDLGPF